MKRSNTLERGSVRYIVFREKNTWYAVALEFNIVESGDDPQEALFLLFDAIQGYVNAARKVKARPLILNQVPDEEYEKLWAQLEDARLSKKPMSIDEVYTFGERALVRV